MSLYLNNITVKHMLICSCMFCLETVHFPLSMSHTKQWGSLLCVLIQTATLPLSQSASLSIPTMSNTFITILILSIRCPLTFSPVLVNLIPRPASPSGLSAPVTWHNPHCKYSNSPFTLWTISHVLYVLKTEFWNKNTSIQIRGYGCLTHLKSANQSYHSS